MTAAPLHDLGLSIPVLAAPMAGGPTTPALVAAAANAGGLGFLAGGYKAAALLGDQIDAVRQEARTFGVNLFAPNPIPVDEAAYGRYRDALRADAERYGADLPERPVEDDDQWRDKVDLLLDRVAPVVSFTFGIPDSASLAALRGAGSILVQTVTSVQEARIAAEAGVDALAVQASAAGGHSGTLTPDRVPPAVALEELLAQIANVVSLPLIAAGGLADPAAVAGAIRAGAQGAMVGTALLLASESGASGAHRAALADPARGDTVVTRAFTGRPARALRNTFIDRYDAAAPAGYPALHHLTSPLRRAATAAGDPEFVNLWAGSGYRSATEAPAGQILRRLASSL
jgi:NAD(P)H-dependent flavin oxidoreductase YrpB (nitropropane dioxygenase family)